MPIDPQAKALLDQLAAQGNLPENALSPHEARLQMEAAALFLVPKPEVGRVEDRDVPGPSGPIRIRLTAPEGPGPFGVLVYFHGGGWVVGSLHSHDQLCRAITRESGVAVVSVSYRLAPEDPFPAAVLDAEAVTLWVAAHGHELGLDPGRMAVGGDSAGGNLAAVVARHARDRGAPTIAFQLLLYPVTDFDLNTSSYLENADGYMLTRELMAWYFEQYTPDPKHRSEPDAAPLRAPDLSRLPPALVITAEYDPLRDEAEHYARRLAEAGVAVRLSRYPGMIHGFIRRYTLLDQGKAALAEVAEALRNALAS
jgi:acetyl esterase